MDIELDRPFVELGWARRPMPQPALQRRLAGEPRAEQHEARRAARRRSTLLELIKVAADRIDALARDGEGWALERVA